MSKSKHPSRVSKAAEKLASSKSTKAEKSAAGKTLKNHQTKQH